MEERPGIRTQQFRWCLSIFSSYFFVSLYFSLAMCPGPGIARRWVVFLMLWPDIRRVGRITSDVITGMCVTQGVRGWPHSYFSSLPHYNCIESMAI